MGIKEREWSDSSFAYRFAFNGMEKDDELKGQGNSYDFGARIYDSRLGRWMSVDPYSVILPAYSPYSYALNSPVFFVDEAGMYPKPSEVLASFGMEMPPLAAGILDGAADASPFGMMGFVYDLMTDDQFRSDMYDAFEAIATDPVGAAKLMFEEYAGVMERVMAGEATPEDEKMIGEEIGGAIVGIITGGAVLKYTKKLVKTGAPNSKLAKKAIKDAPCSCFTEGTDVKTKQGFKNIEEIMVGDSVYAYNSNTQLVQLATVSKLYKFIKTGIYEIYVDSIKIEATKDHPFFLDNDWVEARFLNVGDSLTLFDGGRSRIDSIVYHNVISTVYNFEVAGVNNYYVTELGILVHNCPSNSKITKPKNKEIPISAKDVNIGRNKALSLTGINSSNSTLYKGRMTHNKGLIVGRQKVNANGSIVRYRYDIDADGKFHINVEDFSNGKGDKAIKYRIDLPGGKKAYDKKIKSINN